MCSTPPPYNPPHSVYTPANPHKSTNVHSTKCFYFYTFHALSPFPSINFQYSSYQLLHNQLTSLHFLTLPLIVYFFVILISESIPTPLPIHSFTVHPFSPPTIPCLFLSTRTKTSSHYIAPHHPFPSLLVSCPHSSLHSYPLTAAHTLSFHSAPLHMQVLPTIVASPILLTLANCLSIAAYLSLRCLSRRMLRMWMCNIAIFRLKK